MESKQAGVLLAMLYAMEQESQSTCRTLDQKDQQHIKDLIHLLQVDLSHSQKSTVH